MLKVCLGKYCDVFECDTPEEGIKNFCSKYGFTPEQVALEFFIVEKIE